MAQALRERSVRQATQQQERYPVPVGGLNYHQSFFIMPPTEALVLDNFIPRSYGLEVRKGYQEWIPAANKFDYEVRSVIPFVAQNSSNSLLFVSISDTAGKVYKAPTLNTAPTLVLTPSTNPSVPGEWYYVNYTTPGGSFLCMVSHGAGYYYCNSAGTWTEPAIGGGAGQISFPGGDTTTLKDFVFCFTWKNRLWFVKKNSSTVYYLPVSSITGALTAFELGPLLPHGGAINFATNWTYDSGSGIDDGLVFASEEGDVLVYQGTDPASANTFMLKGVWFVGKFPVGRRCFCSLGGDVLLLTEYGLLRMTDLVSGRIQQATLGESTDSFYKMNPRLSRLIASSSSSRYWYLQPHPTEEILFIGSPYINATSGLRMSFVMNSVLSTWATLSGIEPLSAAIYYGKFMFGTAEGMVNHGFTGYLDGAASDGDPLGTDITARFQTAFNDFGNSSMNKRMLRTKLYGICDGKPSILVKFIPEYDLNTELNVSASSSNALALWDVGKWDEAIWASTNTPLRRWIGVSGFSKKLSLLLGIRGQGYTLLTDYEALFETGINL